MRSTRAPRGAAAAGAAAALRQGAYLTDGEDLFCVVGVISGSSGPKSVDLEDCRTLEVHTYSEPRALALGLTPVRAAVAGDEDDAAGPAA